MCIFAFKQLQKWSDDMFFPCLTHRSAVYPLCSWIKAMEIVLAPSSSESLLIPSGDSILAAVKTSQFFLWRPRRIRKDLDL